jgi:hypothetical protein
MRIQESFYSRPACEAVLRKCVDQLRNKVDNKDSLQQCDWLQYNWLQCNGLVVLA